VKPVSGGGNRVRRLDHTSCTRLRARCRCTAQSAAGDPRRTVAEPCNLRGTLFASHLGLSCRAQRCHCPSAAQPAVERVEARRHRCARRGCKRPRRRGRHGRGGRSARSEQGVGRRRDVTCLGRVALHRNRFAQSAGRSAAAGRDRCARQSGAAALTVIDQCRSTSASAGESGFAFSTGGAAAAGFVGSRVSVIPCSSTLPSSG
jgi:hypothetical protein